MEEVTLDAFQKIDLRVARILEVQDHPKADKLYILKVDLGDETRQIVAGIKNHYKKEELINKKIIIIANLKPAVLRGFESKGMLLAADDGSNVVIVTTDKDIGNGSKIR